MEQKSTCNLDHSLEDIRKKLEVIAPHLPDRIVAVLPTYLESGRTQEELNYVFHLLKKYDLADEMERVHRNKEFIRLLKL
ncbi:MULTISPECIES: hypothetical protein [Aneurinibacillus]|uniref:Group-specific protein n=1 Tax=Aneurinibacillus thermoaerophilus TaxID=143495 RepID=A0A1G7Z5L4_ANETH|nr:MULTISPECIES: hypothetical protein [Aneurinibacillus]AMA72339.1 hypothetical protein ACH33_05370 [Aneurinibacillus sp. XH2]MED0674808.1 hypothetical protein [Aneurinibacillus thermoaerophilus]MED0679758.1 hypothetical protein [Aneurinibacillus thermoaerophilus]MED0735790.1 hypothetical protein [Aneurinibacillus thermoaerophilus]MED0757998.1 hypothetical protein [Aneurinibacillus thermoaerophilus]